MKILFIHCVNICESIKYPIGKFRDIQFGISYISSILKKAGFHTDLLVITHFSKENSIIDYIRKYQPNLICFHCVTSLYDLVCKASRSIRKSFSDIFQVAGGPHVTLNPNEVANGQFNAICIGDGEYPALELVQQLQHGRNPSGIKNLWIKQRNGKVEKNPVRPFIQQLDALPFPDREMWNKYIARENSYQIMIIARGCSFNCSYCSNHALKKVTSGNYVRFRSPQNIIEEIKELVLKYPKIDEILFEAETISQNINFLKKFCKTLKKYHNKYNVKISYGATLRITSGMDYDYIFNLLNDAHFRYIILGLESGSQRIREKILNRFYSNKEFQKAVLSAKKNRLQVRLNVLMGLPTESYLDYKKTFIFTQKLDVDEVYDAIYYPYPKTVLYELCIKKNMINNNVRIIKERCNTILKLTKFPKKILLKEYIWFNYNIFKNKKSRILLIKSVLYRWMNSGYFQYNLYYISLLIKDRFYALIYNRITFKLFKRGID